MRLYRPEAATLAQLSPELLDDLSLAERVGRAFHVLDSVAGFASPLPMPDAIAAWHGYGNNPARRFDVHWKVIKSVFVEQPTASYSMSEHTHITQPCCSLTAYRMHCSPCYKASHWAW